MFLFYIVNGITTLAISGRITTGATIGARLANIAHHPGLMRLNAALILLTGFDAFVLAVAIYALTRDYDRDLALIALVCRIAEGVANVSGATNTMRLLWVATSATNAAPADAAARYALGDYLLNAGGGPIGATFIVASTIYSYIFLRSRTIPAALAWLGLIASLLLVINIPLELASISRGPLGWLMWMPMLAFEVTLGVWLLIKGVNNPPEGRLS